MLCQRRRVSDPCRKGRGIRVLRRLYDSDNRQFFAIFHKGPHIVFIVRFVPPDIILAVIFIVVRAVHQPECNPENIVIGIVLYVFRRFYIFFIDKLPDHLIQLHLVTQSERIEHKITDAPSLSENEHTLIIIFRPPPGFYIVLVLVERRILRHFIKYIRTHHGRHHTVGTSRRTQPKRVKGLIRIHLPYRIPVYPVNLRRHIIRILNGIRILFDAALSAFKISFQ